MKSIKLLFILLFGWMCTTSGQSVDMIRKPKAKGNSLHWIGRYLACKSGCMFGYCDQKTICPDYSVAHEFYVKLPISSAFYIKDGVFYLRQTHIRYFLGNTPDSRSLRVLTDANDRLVVQLYPAPVYLHQASADTTRLIHEFVCRPLSKKELESALSDVRIDELPATFRSGLFELSIYVAPYCSKDLCSIWRYEDTHAAMKKYVKSTPYPILPLLVDTSVQGISQSFQSESEIKLSVSLTSYAQFTTKDIAKLIDTIDEPAFVIRKATLYINPILTMDSLQGTRFVQTKATQFFTALASHPYAKGFQKQVEVEDSWEKFKNKVVLTPWYRLADSTRQAVATELRSNEKLAAEMESFLQSFYQARLVLHVHFDAGKIPEVAYWKYRIAKASNEGKIKNALAYQTSLLRLLSKGVTAEDILTPIPIQKQTITLLNNQYAVQTDFSIYRHKLREVYELDANHAQTKYNLLAAELNAIREQSHSDVYDGMLQYRYLYTRINASTIPELYYAIIKARYYPLESENSENKASVTYDQIKSIYTLVPPAETMILSDDYADAGRFDIATRMLFDKFKDIALSDSALNLQYVVRLLYYGKKSGFEFSDSYYELMLDKVYRFNPALLRHMFDNHELSYILLNNKNIRRKYLKVCRMLAKAD